MATTDDTKDDDRSADETDKDEDEHEDAPDLAERILCSDGACVGVVGPDGKCKECGKPFEPTEARDDAASADDAPFEEGADEEDAPGDSGEAPDLDNRILCSDGACIGVVGPDGKCKECGKPYEPET